MRHDEVNKLLKRGLDQAKFPSTLEPIGLSRKGDGRRPDGLTYPTWKNGKCLIWDFTCADTLCKSYVKKTSTEVGSAAAGREDKKVENTAICQIITILCPWALRPMVLTVLKASS